MTEFAQIDSQNIKPKANENAAHRARMRDKCLEHGFEVLTELETLEFLLFYALPRIDTKPIAKRLMAHFGSFAAVLEAAPHDLMSVSGVGEAAACLISGVLAFNRRYLLDKQTNRKKLKSTDDAIDYMRPFFHGVSQEVVYLICLDASCRPFYKTRVASGSVNSTAFCAQAVAALSLSRKAAGVILAHNHPDGVAVPSDIDINTTRLFMQTLAPLKIALVDHIIITDDNAHSFAESGRLAKLKQSLF